MIRENANIQVVEAMLKAFIEGRSEDALGSFSDNPTWRCPEGTPIKRLYQGRDGILSLFQDLRGQFPGGMQLADLTLHGDRDRVFAEFRTHGATSRGVRIEEHTLVVFELVFGKITTAREFNIGRLRSALSEPEART